MLLGYNEAKEVKGRFREYEIEVKVDNKVHYSTLFARSDSEANNIVAEWQRQCTGKCSRYNYSQPQFTGVGNLSACEIVERVHRANKFQYLLSIVELGNVEYIH